MARRAKGEGNIGFNDKTGRWYGSFMGTGPDGGKKRIWKYGATKEEVGQKLRDARAEDAVVVNTDIAKQTVGEFFEWWLEHNVKPNTEPNTWVGYESHVRNHIAPTIGGVKMSEPYSALCAAVEKVMSTMHKGGSKGKFRRYVYDNVLRAAFSTAVDKGGIKKNPCDGVRRPAKGKGDEKEMQHWRHEEAVVFIDATKHAWLGRLYEMALATGMRQGELSGLRWENIDWEAGEIQVRFQVIDIPSVKRPDGTKYSIFDDKSPLKTKGSVRELPITPLLKNILRRQQAFLMSKGLWGKTEFVFPNKQGGALRKGSLRRSFDKMLRKVCKATGIRKINFHAMRHTFATLALQAGGNILDVSKLLGHANVSITLNTYGHSTPESRRKTASIMDGLFAAGIEGGAK